MDKEGIRSSLTTLPYSRYYLDFETIQFAIPIWLGTRPYQQLPFQWSCHIEQDAETFTHQGYLDVSGQTPMREFLKSLLEALGDDGPILVYTSFEKTVLSGLASMYPEYQNHVESIIARLVDLQRIVRGNYYHPDMQESWSIKNVLPIIAPELDYAGLDEV